MTLNERLWYVRLFFWCLSIQDEFTEGNAEYRVRRHGTNLCHFLRVILVYTPIIFLLHLVLYGGAVAAITYVPMSLMGLGWYFAVAIAIACLVGIIYAIKWYRRWQLNRPAKTQSRAEAQPVQAAAATPKPTSPSFGSLVWQFIVAQKRRVCPLINFSRTQEQTI